MVQVGLLSATVSWSVSPSDQFRDVLRIVDAAQRNGFNGIAIGQHFLYGDSAGSSRYRSPPGSPPRSTRTSGWSPRSSSRRSTTRVMLAEEIATLDVVTEGAYSARGWGTARRSSTTWASPTRNAPAGSTSRWS